MKRILVIGNSGSGKTTFATALAKKTSLPLVHLDKIFWCGNWEHIQRDEFDQKLQAELEKPQWIIDGNFDRTIPQRLRYCDTVFYFDLPTITCLWGITHRVFTSYGKTRPDMGGNCPEYFDTNKAQLYRSVLSFKRKHHKDYERILSSAKGVNVVVFKSRHRAKRYLKSIKV